MRLRGAGRVCCNAAPRESPKKVTMGLWASFLRVLRHSCSFSFPLRFQTLTVTGWCYREPRQLDSDHTRATLGDYHRTTPKTLEEKDAGIGHL
jgi:hypothetical protein